MRYRTLIVLTTLFILVGVLPASAERIYGDEPVGDPLNLLSEILDGDGETDWPANEPFHVRHGYSYGSDLARPWQFFFRLQVDGRLQWPDGMIVWPRDPPGEQGEDINVHTLYNFEDGLEPGEYLFRGGWYIPCHVAEFYGETGIPDCGGKWRSLRWVKVLQGEVTVHVVD